MDEGRQPTEVVILVLPDLTTARQARDDLLKAVGSGRFRADDVVIVQHVRGRVRLHQSSDRGAIAGFTDGALIGALAGLILGTVVAPALLVGTAGAAVARLHDAGLDDHDMRSIGTGLAGGQAALFILADPVSARMISDEVAAVGTVRTFTLHADDQAAVEAVAAQLQSHQLGPDTSQ